MLQAVTGKNFAAREGREVRCIQPLQREVVGRRRVHARCLAVDVGHAGHFVKESDEAGRHAVRC